MSADYYTLLKIRQDATQDEVKRAYRKLAQQFHPDVNSDPNIQERFKEITQAYEVLSNTTKRRKYNDDMGYMTSASAAGNPAGGSPRGSGGVSADFASTMPGNSPSEKLGSAVKYGTMEMVNALIAADAVPDKDMLDYALRWKEPEMVKTLIAAGVWPDQEMMDYAVKRKTTDMVKVLLATGITPYATTVDYAAKYKPAAMVKALLATKVMLDKDTVDYIVRNRADVVSALSPRYARYAASYDWRQTAPGQHGFSS